MTPRRLGLLASLAVLLWTVGWISFHPNSAQAAGGLTLGVQPASTDYGDSPISFNVSCTSGSWTLVYSSDTIRRVIYFQWPLDNPARIALIPSSMTASQLNSTYGVATSTTPGIELSTATATYSDYTKSAWFCRGDMNSSKNQYIKGYVGRDKRDWGWAGAANQQ